MRPRSLLLIGVALLLLAAAPAAGLVAIANLSLPDRPVGILNAGEDPVDLTGWTLADERTTDTYTFPRFTLASWKMVIVHPGRGTNSATDLYWNGGSPDAAWNSDGDVVTFRDAAGTRIADSRGFVLGAPTLPPRPVTPLPTVTALLLPGYRPPVSPIPTPYITTPPAGGSPYGPYGPIAPPYPTTIRTLAPGQTTVPTTLPTVPIPYGQAPIALPTGTPRPVLLPAAAPVSPIGTSNALAPGVKPLPGGKRYAIGKPGAFLGGRFGSGNATAGPGPRTVSAGGTVLKPGSISFGLAPPKGQFVRWYPAARWAAGIR
ncbi:MAG: lamin tail domain-containing protein [Methanospirillum sp.]